MQQSARYAAVIDLLEDIATNMSPKGTPADRVVNAFCRARRYMGSKDRRFVTDHAYSVLRGWKRYLAAAGLMGLDETPRSALIMFLAETKLNPDSVAGEGPHAFQALTESETKAWNSVLIQGSFPAMDETSALNMPGWIMPFFAARTGFDDMLVVFAALNSAAPFDIRLNDRLNPDHDLPALGEWDPIETTSNGYRASGYPRVTQETLYLKGGFEIQDEAAQIGAGLVDAKPGQSVIDLCAGAGGKSLYVAESVGPHGSLKAFDVNRNRLKELSKRAKRSSVEWIETTLLNIGGDRSTSLAQYAQSGDRVIVDAPCSGTGTWRRNPDQRWRYGPEDIIDFQALQLQLLGEGATLVKPEGRLVYMTCSLLPAENEEIVERFLGAHKGWALRGYRDIWLESGLQGDPVHSLATLDQCLQLAPHRHGCDGFFVAILVPPVK